MDDYQKELVCKFFFLFSKFEYALKMARYHCGPGNAKANWDSFGASIDSQFYDNLPKEVSEGVEYINQNPPSKQVVKKNGELDWSRNSPQAETKVGVLLLYVCRVRNNLFHGGKYRGHFLLEPDRSEKLITSCMDILRHALTVSDEVREAYDGGAT
ncbi:hypothetical protein [Microbulbifer variabilis]|uniref:hypothetical protein n=1 Tax=Microbulbifer variabilis TaxID=266805 RepID=UPI001CFF3549|nr:hypothetical protein [Microbulbifer variabilis]